MIRKIIFCSLIFLCCISIILQGQINHQVSFFTGLQITEVTLNDGKTYARVEIPGTAQMDSVGFPSLPVKYIKLIVPAEATDFKVVINNPKTQKYELQYKVEPAQEPVPIGFNDAPGFVNPDKEKYNSNAPYPAEPANIAETGYFKGTQLVTIVVFPCRYYPNKMTVLFPLSLAD